MSPEFPGIPARRSPDNIRLFFMIRILIIFIYIQIFPYLVASAVGLLICTARPATAIAETLWEDPSTPPVSAIEIDRNSGVPFDQALIYPVVMSERTAAIDLLNRQPVVPLDKSQLTRFLGFEPKIDDQIAALITAAEVKANQLEKQSQIPDGELIAQQAKRLEDVVNYVKEGVGKFKPYLIRSVAKNEITGSFTIAINADEVWVFNGCLSRTMLPSKPMPIVVFLVSQPKFLHARAAVIAE